MNFTQCYSQNSIVAYTLASRSDCAVLFDLGSASVPPSNLDGSVLFQKWDAAPTGSQGVRRRALLFFPSDSQHIAEYVDTAISNETWGKLCYWRTPLPNQLPLTFLTGGSRIVGIKQIGLGLAQDGGWLRPRSLDDLDIMWDTDRLLLSVPDAVWVAEDTDASSTLLYATGPECAIDFDPRAVFPIGALEVIGTSTAFENIPFEIGYSRLVANPDTTVQRQSVLRGRVFSASNDGTQSTLALDPRDSDQGILLQDPFLSRVEFASGSQWQSNFVTTHGQKVVFSIPADAEAGFASLQLEMDITDGTTTESQFASFVPVKNFVFSSIQQAKRITSRTSVEPHRIMTGTAPTEHALANIGDTFRFERGNRALLLVDGDPSLRRRRTRSPDDINLGDADQRITTSWLTVLPQGHGDAPTFVSESTKSPLFEPQALRNRAHRGRAVTRLGRTHLQYGTFSAQSFVPVFPWPGSQATAPIEVVKTGPDYETSFLADARRKLFSGPYSRKKRPGRVNRLDGGSTIGVTPQGIVAQITDSNFTALYFGDPDAGSTLAKEFTIGITPATSSSTQSEQDLSEELQRNLRANNLFIVLSQHDGYVDKVIQLRGNANSSGGQLTLLGIAGFHFELGWNSGAKPEDAGIIILKYFRGMSLATLVEKQELWACRSHLAPKLDSQVVTNVAKLPANSGAQKYWSSIWDDKDWQGVLFLNFLPETVSDLVEALGAGMDMKAFRFHDFGLSFLPIKSKDISGGSTPVRIGSAFGLLCYDKAKATTIPATVGNEKYEPIDTTTGELPTTPDYKFRVNFLEVAFNNSRIASFHADADMFFSHFMWDEAVTPPSPHADPNDPKAVLNLVASYEAKDGDDQSSMLRLTTKEGFNIKVDFTKANPKSFLQELEITAAELRVTNVRPLGNAPRQIAFFIGVKGDLKFDPAQQPFHELVHVNSVHLDQLGLEIDYQPANSDVKCRFRADGVRADVEIGDVRDSLFSICPLKLKGFRMAIGSPFDLKALNYFSFPGLGGAGKLFDFAFDLEIDFGKLGGLMGGAGGLKFPLILGWRKKTLDFGFGIQFPNLNKKGFEIGIQQFVAIRAEKADFHACRSGGNIVAQVIAFKNVRLVFFGKEWPSNFPIDLALFIGTNGERKFAWIFGHQAPPHSSEALQYIAAGHRVLVPSGTTAEAIIASAEGYLTLEPGKDPCALLSTTDKSQDGWMVLFDYQSEGLFEAWMAICDNPAVYALTLKLIGKIKIGAAYRRVNDKLGVYSAEVNLADTIPPMQFGVVSVRLPKIATEVYTDGGWLINLGFDGHDFGGGCQIEFAIFLGTIGMYFGYTSAMATKSLLIEEGKFGYHAPPATIDNDYVKSLCAIRAGLSLRVGIGRSIDLGILKGEASISVYGIIEGAVVFKDGLNVVLYSIKGTTGIMVLIKADLDFIVLQASASLCAYLQFELVLSKVLAYQPGGLNGHYWAATMPIVIAAEVGIHLHFEVWVTIGCVRVKLFDLNFSATWRIEEEIGGFDPGPELPGHKARKTAHPALAAARQGMPRIIPQRGIWGPPPSNLRTSSVQTLTIYAVMMPCVADPADLGQTTGQYVPCLVGQMMLDVHKEFVVLAQFLTAWALGLPDYSQNPPIFHSDIDAARRRLRDEAYWNQTGAPQLLAGIQGAFDVTVVEAQPDPDPTDPVTTYAVIPAWPGITWGLEGAKSNDPKLITLPPGRGVSTSTPGVGDAGINVFLDYLRLLTLSFLAEMDRQVKASGVNPGPHDDPMLPWDKIWEKIAPKQRRRRVKANRSKARRTSVSTRKERAL
ncbi:hypothetical protein [Prosthecobacter sp.]|uniref:hypothetical protein n=1 Tax=Prosthecobacter sp. TaxID=1965333 RepID=UPI003783E15E